MIAFQALVVKPYDDGTNDRKYSHALVTGIDKYPRKVTKDMGKKTLEARNKLKPFVKVRLENRMLFLKSGLRKFRFILFNFKNPFLQVIAYSHLLPTRYSVDVNFDKTSINKESLKDPSKKRRALREAKAKLEEKHKAGKNKWFFSKLRF